MKNSCSIIVFLVLYFGINEQLLAQSKEVYLAAQFIEQEDTLNYRILYPQSFDPSQSYPLLIFLHGAGERGNDNQKQLVHGGDLFLQDSVRENYPAIIIFPQCEPQDYWAKADIDRSPDGNSFEFNYSGEPNKNLGLVISLLEAFEAMQFVDNNRIYVGGLSMGGMGTYELLYRKPSTFAAAFSICGAGNPYTVGNYAQNTALWIFHGGKDDIVNPDYAHSMSKALKNAGGDVRKTIYPEANHNSWDPALSEPNLLKWLFSNTK